MERIKIVDATGDEKAIYKGAPTTGLLEGDYKNKISGMVDPLIHFGDGRGCVHWSSILHYGARIQSIETGHILLGE